MADSTTPILSLLLMGDGGHTNSWITDLNNQVITLVDQALNGVIYAGPMGVSGSPGTVVNAILKTGATSPFSPDFGGVFRPFTQANFGAVRVFGDSGLASNGDEIFVSLEGVLAGKPRIWLVDNQCTGTGQLIFNLGGVTIPFTNVGAAIVPSGLHAVYLDTSGLMWVW